jgi:phage tail sheath gpL-like
MSVDVSAVARVLGITTEYKDLRGNAVVFLPQRVAVIGQGATASTYVTTPVQSSRPADIGATFGFGSPLHLAAKKLFPTNGDGIGTIPATFYPLQDNGSGVVAAGDIAPTGAATETAVIYVYVGEVRSEAIVIPDTSTVAAACALIHTGVSAILDMPMTSADGTTSVDLTSKWQGVSANGIKIRIEGSVAGLTLGITQPVNGAANPLVDPALAAITSKWETLLLNCLESADTTALTAIQTHGEGRWGTLERKPYVCFTGDVQSVIGDNPTPQGAATVPQGRKTDRINSFLVAPGSGELPFLVAARQLARIAKLANNDPAFDYGAQRADGILPGTDAQQWTYSERDEAIKKGVSTIEVLDNIINISDVVTFYHPSGDPLPAYRHAVDIVKLQNIIFNLELIFAVAAWNGAPLLPDGDPTTNANAKTPAMAVAAVNTRLEALGLAAIISDVATAKASTFASIDSQNPKRLNVETTVQLSGNTNIVSVNLNFGFYFGAAQLVA